MQSMSEEYTIDLYADFKPTVCLPAPSGEYENDR